MLGCSEAHEAAGGRQKKFWLMSQMDDPIYRGMARCLPSLDESSKMEKCRMWFQVPQDRLSRWMAERIRKKNKET